MEQLAKDIQLIIQLIVFVCVVAAGAPLRAQEIRLPAEVKDIDDQISKLKDLPEDVRARKIKELSPRILKGPKTFLVTLAANLANAGTEGGSHDTLQVLAATLAEALRRAPEKDPENDIYTWLAEMVRYNHLEVTLDSPRYRTEMAQLEDDDKVRARIDLTLPDLDGRTWSLKSLRGSVVLVNFWYSWCKSCLREIPDLKELKRRFKDRGLVILNVLGEDAEGLRPLIAQGQITGPVLVDHHDKVKIEMRIIGIPRSLVYDRDGAIVGQAIERPAVSGWLDMLERAGLK